MSANDDYPWQYMNQQYQKMCDEIDDLRLSSRNLMDEVNRLTAWKLEACKVLTQWDEVAALVPPSPEQLGKLKSEDVSDYIEHLRDLDDAAGKEIEALKDQLLFYEANYTGDPD